ncbi:MAG TPA: hypothetical protein VMH00_13095 [Candidatus Limnocylindrales bacterium]|nr:hypothetical protein [Candidatus Limnocylindrales bacterium]
MDSRQPSTQRRRSERVAESLPIVVRGIDLLGQPFEERTSTLAFNLHGCRYASKHHLPKNTWVTVELARKAELHNVRARVAWIQRPHSVREFFQIAVELETPGNIWAFEPVPPSWEELEAASRAHRSAATPQAEPKEAERFESEEASQIPVSMDRPMGDTTRESSAAAEPSFAEASAGESPLLRELSAELERRAQQAANDAAERASERILRAAEEAEQKRSSIADEFLRKWKEEFEQAQAGAQEQFSVQIAAKQNEFLMELKSGIEDNLSRVQRLIEEVEKKTEVLRSENDAAAEAASRVAHARLELEAVEAARASQPAAHATERAKEDPAGLDAASASWRQRIESEMSLAQGQWNELLQSSLDSNMQRLIEQLSERSEDVLRRAEQRMSDRFTEIRQPLTQTATEARETLAEVTTSLEEELARARGSLKEIENSASRMNEFSAQLEAATQDTLNELRRRLEGVLDTQTEEMKRRLEGIAESAAQKVGPVLDGLGQRVLEQTLAEMDAKVAPRMERLPQLLRELSTREMQMEEGLRLHRERLRQVAENTQREISSHLVSAAAEVRNDFETARREAIAQWNEELEASGVRASHATAESIERSSHWFEQEARARLQVLVEQTLATAGTGLSEKSEEAKQKFASELEAETWPHVAQIRERLDSFAGELTNSSRSQIEQAAEVAAAAFGQVLRGISDQEVEHFANASQGVVRSRSVELESSAQRVLQDMEESAQGRLGDFRAQMAAQLEASLAEGRTAVAGEFQSLLDVYQAERDTRQKEWEQNLERIGDEATHRHEERLETACDSWMISSVRRLNEHGQNVIESLMRSTDQGLRDSCARFFEGIAETLRDRVNGSGIAASAYATLQRDAADVAPPPPAHSEGASNHPNA